jgi:hypothetical protein
VNHSDDNEDKCDHEDKNKKEYNSDHEDKNEKEYEFDKYQEAGM